MLSANCENELLILLVVPTSRACLRLMRFAKLDDRVKIQNKVREAGNAQALYDRKGRVKTHT